MKTTPRKHIRKIACCPWLVMPAYVCAETLALAIFAATVVPAETNLAPLASPSTSFVSGHETLEAINDGFEPKASNDHSHGCYGNWPQTGKQWVEYELDLPAGALRVDICALPTERLHDGRGLAYAVSLNGGQPKVFDVHAGEGEGTWWENVKRGFCFRSVTYAANQPRKLKLRIYLLDPGLVLQDIQVYEAKKR